MNKFAATPPQEAPSRHPAPEVGLRAQATASRHPAPGMGSWLQAFLAFLMHFAGLIPQPDTPEGRAAAQALRELQDLIANYARGERTAEDRRPCRHHTPRVRIPRAERRLRLTPGIYAALFFTPRAAIAARARFAAGEPGVAAALRTALRSPFSIFGLLAAGRNHDHFILIS